MWPGSNTWFQPVLLLAVLKPEKSLQRSPWTLRSHLRIYMSSHVDLAIKQSAPIYTRNDLPTNTPTAGWNIQKKTTQRHVCFKVTDCFLLPPSLLFFFSKKNVKSYQHDTSPIQKTNTASQRSCKRHRDLWSIWPRATGWIHDVDSPWRGDSRFEPPILKKICNRQVGTFPQGSGWKYVFFWNHQLGILIVTPG